MSSSEISGLLIDLDGVIYQDSKLIKGALETLDFCKDNGIAVRFLTNTTTKTRKQIQLTLSNLGIQTPEINIFSALYAARTYIKKMGYGNIFPLIPSSVKNEFYDVMAENQKKDAVLVGDLGKEFNYSVLNEAFGYLVNGADLIAAHKNRFWQKDKSLQLDAGGFVALLEFAADIKAKVIGKPSLDFFNMAIRDLKLEPRKILMIGDDIVSDIQGAQNSGIAAVQVRTGKFRPEQLQHNNIKPDYIIESIAELPELINQIK